MADGIAPQNALETMNEWRKIRKYCDFTFVVEDREFPCHMSVVATAHPYFLKILEESNSTTVRLDDVDKEYFDLFLDYLYTARTSITKSTVDGLLLLGIRFNTTCLTRKCMQFLEQIIDVNNALHYYNFGERIAFAPLMEYVKNFVQFNFTSFSTSDSFLDISFRFLTELVLSNFTFVDEVFRSVVRWVNHSPEIRKPYLAELFRQFLAKFAECEDKVKDIFGSDVLEGIISEK